MILSSSHKPFFGALRIYASRLLVNSPDLYRREILLYSTQLPTVSVARHLKVPAPGLRNLRNRGARRALQRNLLMSMRKDPELRGYLSGCTSKDVALLLGDHLQVSVAEALQVGAPDFLVAYLRSPQGVAYGLIPAERVLETYGLTEPQLVRHMERLAKKVLQGRSDHAFEPDGECFFCKSFAPITFFDRQRCHQILLCEDCHAEKTAEEGG